MNCPKCGIPVEADAAFCPVCGEKIEAPAAIVQPEDDILCPNCGVSAEIGAEYCAMCGSSLETVQPREDAPENKIFTRLSVILSIIGVGLSLLIFIISWACYDKVYFFNGYGITKVGWIVSFAALAAGIVLFIIGIAKRRHHAKNLKRRIIVIGALVLFFAAIMIASAIINKAYEDRYSYTPTYTPSFGSCHTTQEHIIAIHYYDFDGDNSISGFEMEAFIDDHPGIGYDQGFIDYFS